MNYLKAKTSLPFELMLFTDKGSLVEYLGNGEGQILITGDDEIIKKASQNKNLKIVRLSEELPEDMMAESAEYHPVFKYQSTENIIREVTAYCVGGADYINPCAIRCKKGYIVGVYSPVGRCYKTTFALAVANVLGKQGKTLYVNLEEYSGLSEDMLKASKGSLSELLYMYRRGSGGWRMRFNEIAGTLGRFDYIPPAVCPEDVSDVMTEEWVTFLDDMLERTEYEFLVVDVGTLIRQPENLLEIMNVIYMPVMEDVISQRKIKGFYDNMKRIGKGIFTENIEKITIPKVKELEKGEYSIEQIEWSALGSFARKVINERNI